MYGKWHTENRCFQDNVQFIVFWTLLTAGKFLMDTLYTIHILNHNYNPVPLLDSLTRQISLRTENIRVMVWDDGSNPPCRDHLMEIQSKYNQKFLTWCLENGNHGRSAMRQKILESAEKGWMISIDSDMLPDPDFIEQAVSSLQKTNVVYAGYHYYQDEPPAEPYFLHWNYGRLREVPAQNKDPYTHFSTGIFALHASIAMQLYFDQSIQSYGHEDTLFGLLLQEKGFPVRPTPMKAVHKGLSQSELFIEKQLESVHNLQFVLSKYPDYQNQLINWSKRINKLPLFRTLLSSDPFKKFCLRKLRRNPNQLVYLDLLKLNENLRILGR